MFRNIIKTVETIFAICTLCYSKIGTEYNSHILVSIEQITTRHFNRMPTLRFSTIIVNKFECVGEEEAMVLYSEVVHYATQK